MQIILHNVVGLFQSAEHLKRATTDLPQARRNSLSTLPLKYIFITFVHRNRTNKICNCECVFVCVKGIGIVLVHLIMKAEKAHGLSKQAGHPRNLVMQFKDLRTRRSQWNLNPSVKAWEPECWGQEKQNIWLKHSENKFNLPLSFCSILILNEMDVYPHWRGPSALLSVPIQMLASCGNTVTVKLSNNP